jgi:hypothetical protein
MSFLNLLGKAVFSILVLFSPYHEKIHADEEANGNKDNGVFCK